MLKQEQVTLGKGFTYKITQLPLRESRALLIKMTNLLGPAFGDAVTGDSEGFTVDGSSIGSAIKTLASDISEEDFTYIQQSLFNHIVWVNKEGHDIPLNPITDEHFAGGSGLGRMFKLLFEALKANYADFLAELGLAGLLPAQSQPGSPRT